MRSLILLLLSLLSTQAIAQDSVRVARPPEIPQSVIEASRQRMTQKLEELKKREQTNQYSPLEQAMMQMILDEMNTSITIRLRMNAAEARVKDLEKQIEELKQSK